MGRNSVLIAAGLVWAAAASAADSPAGWKPLRDKGGACRLAVPAGWTVNQQLPNMALAPDGSHAIVTGQVGKSVTPIPEVVQQALGVGHLFENTPQRVFWAGKPASYKGGPPMVSYHVTVPTRGGTCEASIVLKSGTPDDVARHIAATLAGSR